MALVSMKNLLSNAESNNIAVGAFSVGNMEMIIGTVAAAEEMNTSVILQLSESMLKKSPLEIIGPAMMAAAENAKVNIAVHFDRATRIEMVEKALNMGFTSIMFDGSDLPFHETIQSVKEIRKIAEKTGASVEAKFTAVNTSETEFLCTSPDDAKLFCDETGVDALEVIIGNVSEDNSELMGVRYDVLDDIHRMAAVPLSLNNVAYLSAETLQQSIMLGVRKININSTNFQSLANRVSEYCKTHEEADYLDLSAAMVEGVYQNVKKYIKIFNMQTEI